MTAFSTDPIVQQPSRLHAAVSRAFSSVIDATREEAIFAIFGHWGRGKSFIARTIAKDRSATHRTIFFNSWRYPHAPACWAFLYETILNEVKKSGDFVYLKTILRRNVLRSGVWPAVAAEVSVFFVCLGLLQRVGWIADALWWIVSVFGLSVVALSARLWFGGWKVGPKLQEAYASVASHKDKLGLQETLGDDIRLLVSAWLGGNAKQIDAVLSRLLTILIVLAVALPGVYLLVLQNSVLQLTAPGAVWGAWIAWNALIISFVLFARWPGRRQWLLLVIEDLDRCPPGAAIHVIESVALLLEPTIAEGTIQALALIDEATLDTEIAEKFSTKPGPATVHSHKEKLFTASIRLPPLKQEDFAGITGIFLLKSDYDAAAAAVNAAKDELTKSSKLADSLRSSLKLMESEKGPAIWRKRTITVPKMPVPPRYNPRIYPDGGPDYFETKEIDDPPTQVEIDAWKAEHEQRMQAVRTRLVEEEGSRRTKLIDELAEAERSLKALETELDAQVQKAEISAQESDTSGYARALDTTPDERKVLRAAINQLPLLKGYEWGPRSAHVVNKKYLLFKLLWVAVQPTADGEPKDLTEAERIQLVQAFFLSFKSKFEIAIPGPQHDDANRRRELEKMQRIAEYVV